MLLHISEDHTSATVVSFPRDMFVNIPGCIDTDGSEIYASAQKINTTYFYGGLPCTVKTVENITGLTIPFAAEIEFYGVVGLSNALGGVTVCVAEEIQDDYTGLYLTPGEHTLQGMDALQFLRTRHGVGDGSDITRISISRCSCRQWSASSPRTARSATPPRCTGWPRRHCRT